MILDGSVYTGNSLKDRVIFKSLYLQNLGLLSYYRQKAYNYLGADKIPPKIENVPVNLDNSILCGTQNDFIFDSDWVNDIEKLTEQDFINYSAVELKLSLLFGLKSQYRDFIVHHGSYVNKKLALWMITRRRGLIFIEMDLLLRDAFFEMFFSHKELPEETVVFKQVDRKLKYRELLSITHAFQQNTGQDLEAMLDTGTFSIGITKYKLITATGGAGNEHYRPIPNTNYSFTVRTHCQKSVSFENTTIFDNRILAIFPSFIGQFKETVFGQRLNFFFQNALPLQITCGCHFIDGHTLEKLIPAFTTWHNALIHHHQTSEIAGGELKYYAAALARLINDINPDAK